MKLVIVFIKYWKFSHDLIAILIFDICDKILYKFEKYKDKKRLRSGLIVFILNSVFIWSSFDNAFDLLAYLGC